MTEALCPIKNSVGTVTTATVGTKTRRPSLKQPIFNGAAKDMNFEM